MIEINRNSLLPLYHQVEESIRQAISEKMYVPGKAIPTETELQDLYDVSRETVRKAVNNLVQAGLLEKRKGVGTFVTRPKIVHRLGRLYGSTEEILARQASPGTTFIERKKLKAPESLADLMGLNEGDHIIKVKRLRFVNSEPVAILSSYLPEDLVPNLIDVEFKDNSLYKTLEGIYGFRLREADEVIEAGSISRKDAKWLEVPKMTPILVVKRLTYLDTGRVIEKLTALYRSDRFKYQVKLEGRPENRL